MTSRPESLMVIKALTPFYQPFLLGMLNMPIQTKNQMGKKRKTTLKTHRRRAKRRGRNK